MPRKMLDSLHPLNIPADTPTDVMIAAYRGHSDNLNSYAQACERFPDHIVVSINSHANANAQVLDVENGAVDPRDESDIVNWVAIQRSIGGDPIIYVQLSNWALIQSYFPTNPPQWWVAYWEYADGRPIEIPEGAIGVQYANSDHATPPGAYDSSMMADYIKGIDMPQPEAPTVAEIWSAPIVVPPMWDSNHTGNQEARWVLSQCLSVLTAALCTQAADGTVTVVKVGTGSGGGITVADLISTLNETSLKVSV